MLWSSNNSQLSTVRQQDVPRTRGRSHCTVTVSVVRNPRIKAHAQVRGSVAEVLRVA